IILDEEGAAGWPATGPENRGGSQGQGFDSFTLLQVRTGVIATGRHARLKPELMVVRVHPPVPRARAAQLADAVGLNPPCWGFEASRGYQVSSASVAQ